MLLRCERLEPPMSQIGLNCNTTVLRGSSPFIPQFQT